MRVKQYTLHDSPSDSIYNYGSNQPPGNVAWHPCNVNLHRCNVLGPFQVLFDVHRDLPWRRLDLFSPDQREYWGRQHYRPPARILRVRGL